MEQKKINYSLLVTIAITIIGWSTAFGVAQNKLEQHEKELARIEKNHNEDVQKLQEKQDKSDVILNSINVQLAALNSKIELLINNKIKE